MSRYLCLFIAVATTLIPNQSLGGEWVPANDTINNSECTLWSEVPLPDEQAAWYGPCLDGRANGQGVAIWEIRRREYQMDIGNYHKGRPHGLIYRLQYLSGREQFSEGFTENWRFFQDGEPIYKTDSQLERLREDDWRRNGSRNEKRLRDALRALEQLRYRARQGWFNLLSASSRRVSDVQFRRIPGIAYTGDILVVRLQSGVERKEYYVPTGLVYHSFHTKHNLNLGYNYGYFFTQCRSSAPICIFERSININRMVPISILSLDVEGSSSRLYDIIDSWQVLILGLSGR